MPAVRKESGDPSALAEVEDEMGGWETLLSGVERLRLKDPGFSKAWAQLKAELQRHMQRGHQGLLDLSNTLQLNYVDMGLRMEELRRQIMAERPPPSQDTSN